MLGLLFLQKRIFNSFHDNKMINEEDFNLLEEHTIGVRREPRSTRAMKIIEI
jgi:hypothetical protein